MALEHWRYFLALESDLEQTFRYVEPANPNLKTYSIEFARLILSACSEIDVVCKVLCAKINPNAAARNIDDYRTVVVAMFPSFPPMPVHVPRFSLSMHPWREWGNGANPGWWRDHNMIKHARHDNFHLADFEHAVVSMGALFALLMYLYQQELYSLRINPTSEVFRLTVEPTKLLHGRYELPDFPHPAA